MGIKNKKKKLEVSKREVERVEKSCSAIKETIVFSFSHMTTCEDYNFQGFKKKTKNSETANAIATFIAKLEEISKLTWNAFSSLSKSSGYEMLPVSTLDDKFINHLDIAMSGDEKLMIVRFNSQNSRMVLRRGTKCNRVAHVLGIDYDLKLYKH